MIKWQRILLTGLMLTSVNPVLAAEKNTTVYFYRTSNANQTIITEDKAIVIAQRLINGRVLAINFSDQRYRIKILDPQGSMHIILIDAQDGSIISTQ